MKELREKYNTLDLLTRRSILIDEVMELCLLIERICKNKNIEINKISKDDLLINKNKLNEGEYLDYMFSYILNLKENLGLLLEDL